MIDVRAHLADPGPALELFARQWCSSPSDVVQDALVELARLQVVPENLVGWLYRVVRNRAIDAPGEGVSSARWVPCVLGRRDGRGRSQSVSKAGSLASSSS